MEHGAEVIHINYKSAQVDQVYFPQIEVVGDIALSGCIGRARLEVDIDLEILRRSGTMSKERFFHSTKSRISMRPQNIVSAIRNLMGYHDIIALDKVFTKSGLQETTRHSSPTRYCLIMLWPRWAQVYHLQCLLL